MRVAFMIWHWDICKFSRRKGDEEESIMCEINAEILGQDSYHRDQYIQSLETHAARIHASEVGFGIGIMLWCATGGSFITARSLRRIDSRLMRFLWAFPNRNISKHNLVLTDTDYHLILCLERRGSVEINIKMRSAGMTWNMGSMQ